MADRFHPLSMEQLCGWIFGELSRDQSIFGIPRELFFTPRADDRFRRAVYGHLLETPFGVAAGPHTQLAQNIIVAWLCGARFIELKTVQTLDELQVPRPCIDMQDAGYNVEWSQELKVDQSIAEYQRAWVLIHALHRHLGFPGERPGVIFNLSVGYNLAGLKQPNVQRFLAAMRDAGPALDPLIEAVARWMPEVRDLPIPRRLSDNVTLSTMHGCPPAEIGLLATYLMEIQGLHTAVKLNPTLLGPETVRDLLNRRLGYSDIQVPDAAFAHDLKYPDAIRLLRELQLQAERCGVGFGVKLSNTLEVVNHRAVFPAAEKMMYLSGRPLHPLAVQLAHRLSEEFEGSLTLSFAGGADAFNAADLLASGMQTVTACSDLLRSGGYTRLGQYIAHTRAALAEIGATDLDDFVCRRAAAISGFAASACGCVLVVSRRRKVCSRLGLRDYADQVLENPRYRRDAFARGRTKTTRPLGRFDCIKAPCTDECPVNQQVPRYMQLVRQDRLPEAALLTREDNPLAAILGRACHHPCQEVCIRTHYDEPVAIREIKRYIMDHERRPKPGHRRPGARARVAIVGSGPCGLSAAYFLARAGQAVTLFEARAYAGGMVAGSIPGYRAVAAVIAQDLDLVLGQGVEMRYGQKAGRDFTLDDLRGQGFTHIVVAAGAQLGQQLGIPDEDAPGVLDALDFLRLVREGRPPALGARVGVVGGGDVAMDCARTAWRLGAGEVSLIYRRTRDQMPAQYEERRGLEEEGIPVRELLAPQAVVVEEGRVCGLRCARTRLGDPDASGRRRPLEVPGEIELVPLDTVIVAISQRADLSLFGQTPPALNPHGYLEVDPATLATSLPGVFAGGDVIQRGPATIVKAVGDGKRIAAQIQAEVGGTRAAPPAPPPFNRVDLLRRRSLRQWRVPVPERAPDQRRNFQEIVATLTAEQARAEAARCLDCDTFCSFCVGVCPNLAFFTYTQAPVTWPVPVLAVRDGRVTVTGTQPFTVAQKHQVALLADACNECGNCVTFCPTAGRPYRDKPRFFVAAAEFAAQSDNAFRLVFAADRWTLQGRFGGELHQLTLGRTLEYTSPHLAVKLDPESWAMREARAEASSPAAPSLEPCAVLYALLRGVRGSLPWFPAVEV